MTTSQAPGASSPSLSSSKLALFSAVELAVVLAACLGCLASGVFVASVAAEARKTPSVAPFTQLWAPRLVLHGVGTLCLAAMLLRLPAWWALPAGSWASGTGGGKQALLCRLSPSLAYGVALPTLSSLAVAVLALPRGPLLPGAEGGARRGLGGCCFWGTQRLRPALLAAAPFAAAQTLLAFHDPLLGDGRGLRARLPARWVDCFASTSPGRLACRPALASAFLSLVSALVFGAALALHCRRLAGSCVSRRLAARTRWLGLLLGAAPLASALLRGAAQLWSQPHSLRFELLMAADFAAVILAVAACILPLSILPSAEAAAAGRALANEAEAPARTAAPLLRGLSLRLFRRAGERDPVPNSPASAPAALG